MSEQNHSVVNTDFVDLFLKLAEIEYTVLTPNYPQKGPVSCRANDKTFLRDIFPFNSQYREHLFFVSYYEKLEENTDKWLYIKLMLRQLWEIRIEQHQGDLHNPGYEFCFGVDTETHDIRILDRCQLKGCVYKLKNQYRDSKIDAPIKKTLEDACSNIVQALDNYGCVFGTALRESDQLDIAFGFLISDGLMNDLIKDYPFKSVSSCVTCIRIKKWPHIGGEEKDNSKVIIEKEGDKYKAFDGDIDNTRNNNIELDRDRSDIPDDSRKKYGNWSEMNDLGNERGGS